MKKVRWGIAGPGEIANKFARAIKNVDGAELCAVASRSEERGRAFAEKYDIPEVYCGYESMAASDSIDAVYVSTPHPFHTGCAKLFMDSKKHVLCEKPLCINAVQAQSLKECAEKNGVFLMEAVWTRFLPAIREIKRRVENREIGDIVEVDADFCYASSPEEEEKLFRNDMAGGSLLDVGVYGLHFAAMFLGRDVDEISVMSDIKNGADIRTNILLGYKSGATASVSSAIGLKKPEIAHIYGTKGYITVPQFYGASEFYVHTDDCEQHIVMPPAGEGFEEEIVEACNCINEGRMQSDMLPLEESVGILKITDRIREKMGLSYPFEGEIR